MLNTATRRTAPVGCSRPDMGRRLPKALVRSGRRRTRDLAGRVLSVFLLEGAVDLEQHLLLTLAERGIAHDRGDEVGGIAALVEDPGAHVERLGRDAQAPRDALEDL